MLMLVVGRDEKVNQAFAHAIHRAYELHYAGNRHVVMWSSVSDPEKRTKLSELTRVAQTRYVFAAPDVEIDIRIQPLTVEEYRSVITDPLWAKTRPDCLVVFHSLDQATEANEWLNGFVTKNDGDIYVQRDGIDVDETFFAASGNHFLRRTMALNALHLIERLHDVSRKDPTDMVGILTDIASFIYDQVIDIEKARIYG